MKNKKELLTILGVGLCGGILLTMSTQFFFDNYRLQSPIVFRSLVVKKYTSPIPTTKVSPTPQISPTRVVTPTKGIKPSPTPKKKVMIKEVQASETTLKTSDQQIADYIKSKDWDYSIAIRLAKSENFWNLTKSFDCARTGGLNKNGTRDHGLWQINDIHINSGAITLEDANDCYKATDFAYGLYKGRGNQWTAWSAFTNGSYLNHTEDIN